VTYQPHAFELHAREFYGAKMLEILQAAGAQFGFIAPLDSPPQTSHVMGTLRMGTDARTSVCDPGGRFHDVDNLWCTDGAVFPTSSGFNPTLTIQAMALRTAGGMLFGEAPERVLQ
jgi:paromamine 6'-oxidase/6'''-hydroxyneomycin C oxidase/2'-deamino-2'-hydroxyparomamine 6'-oxidase